MNLNFPLKKINEILKSRVFDNKDFNKEVLDAVGFFVLRQGISEERAAFYYKHFKEKYNSGAISKSKYHNTEVPVLGNEIFEQLKYEPQLKRVWPHFFDGIVGNDFIRILIKNKEHRKPVFLHQDIGYQCGGDEQYSFFTSLSSTNKKNGGLQIVPGTHKLGYLGDVGEINRDILPKGFPVCSPELSPGDILIMHSAAWHFSAVNEAKTERIYVETHVIPGNSPYCKNLLYGKQTMEYSAELDIAKREMDNFFVNSRSSRLKKAEQALSQLNSLT
ncbi:phytanoyl-CoA dioxygenase family protein [Flavobacteriaceae bacterium]|nr:phytanoyl-CoA dioxygenase family protein [Flavobacteriaceae bacterium]